MSAHLDWDRLEKFGFGSAGREGAGERQRPAPQASQQASPRVAPDIPAIALEPEEEEEFRLLVAEMKPLGFTHSSQVSSYIMRNRLGQKYRNISGVVRMARDGDTWDFKGGFPPRIYAALCLALGLGNHDARARAVGFRSFRELAGGG